jgi:hypothetical protein
MHCPQFEIRCLARPLFSTRALPTDGEDGPVWTPSERSRRLSRRAIVGGVLLLQIAMIVRAYGADHAFFGFQMFPETSEWSAEIVRVDHAGVEHDIRDPWPGGYSWGEMVNARGLGVPWRLHPADAGMRSTLDFLDHALDWVAEHTPRDHETERLVARVTYWRNGLGPITVTLTSSPR